MSSGILVVFAFSIAMAANEKSYLRNVFAKAKNDESVNRKDIELRQGRNLYLKHNICNEYYNHLLKLFI